MRALATAAAASLLLALPASALEIAGVKVADTSTLDGKTLLLNGAGIRTRTFLKVKVYVGALYLPQRTSDAAAVVALDAPKQIRLTLLRNVDRESMLKAFREGIENNSPGQSAALESRLKRVESAFPAEFKEGQSLTVSYLPGKGTVIGVEGEKADTIEGKDFSDALFRIWLGTNLSDGGLENLKESMLAGK